MENIKRNGNDKNRKKHLLDIGMTAIFALLMVISLTGLVWHEWLGILFAGMFTLHLIWNAAWIKGVTRNLFSPKVKGRTKFLYVMNAALLLAMGLCTISGIFISGVLFTFIQVGNAGFWGTLHAFSAYTACALCAGHLLMHARLILNGIKRIPEHLRNSRPATIALRLLAAVLVIVGIKSTFSTAVATANADSASSGSTSSDSDNGAASEVIAAADNSSAAGGTSTTGGSVVDDDTAAVQASADADEADVVSMEEYLGSLHCTACHRNCLLTNPQCGRGEKQAEEATAEYESSVQSSAVTDTLSANAGCMTIQVSGIAYSVTLPTDA